MRKVISIFVLGILITGVIGMMVISKQKMIVSATSKNAIEKNIIQFDSPNPPSKPSGKTKHTPVPPPEKSKDKGETPPPEPDKPNTPPPSEPCNGCPPSKDPPPPPPPGKP